MKQVIVKSLRVLWQILGVLLTVFVISLVRVLLREGFGLEVYASTIGLIVVIAICGVIWTFGKMKKAKKANTQHPLVTVKLSLEDQPKVRSGKMAGQIVVVLATLAVLSGLFYWFQIRPSQIRKDCDKSARERNVYHTYEQYKAYYIGCLHERGLE